MRRVDRDPRHDRKPAIDQKLRRPVAILEVSAFSPSIEMPSAP